MKQFTIVVKPFRAEAVLRAIAELDVISCVVREAKGYSRQKGYLDRYAGSEYSMAFLFREECHAVFAAGVAVEIAFLTAVALGFAHHARDDVQLGDGPQHRLRSKRLHHDCELLHRCRSSLGAQRLNK